MRIVPRRRLLVLASYPRSAAATRFRACAYFPALAERGIDAVLRSFLDEPFLRDFYRRGARAKKALGLARFVAQRAALAIRGADYDGVLVQREAALIGPACTEAIFALGYGLPLVFDFDDAIWVDQWAASRHPLAARVLKSPGKTDHLLRMSREVVVGSKFLAEYASKFLPREHITVLPTVVSRELFRPLPGRLEGGWLAPDEVPIIGWVGSHTTGAHLDVVVPALRALAREGERFRVRLVGAGRTLQIPGVEVESVPWTQESEVADYQRIDIGIAPLTDDAWSRGKCAFKQVQYMAVGAPMVSSPVGGASELLTHGETALLAETTDEWIASLRSLLRDRALRSRLAGNGRQLVEDRLCTEAQAPTFVEVIERALHRS